jgi:putative ABC transport system permease protein
MAWRNLWRNPRRTGVVLTAIAVGISGCVLSMSINTGMVAGMVDTAIRGGLAHLQVHASGWDENPQLEVRLDDGGSEIAEALDGIPEIESWAPRLKAQGLVASPRASMGVAIMGVDPKLEAGVSIAVDSLTSGEWLGQPRRVVLGYKLAARLEVEVGGKLVVSVQDIDGELTGQAFRVSGLLRSGAREIDDGVVFMRIEDAQRLLGMDHAISEIAIVTTDRDRVAVIQSKLEARIGAGPEVRTWEQLQPLLIYMIDSLDSVAWVIYAAIFIAMAFGIANVLMMAVFERTREIGMMRAVGMSRLRVVSLVVLESSFVTAIGLALGVGLAVLGVWLIGDGIDISAWGDSLDEYGVESMLKPSLKLQDLIAPLLIGAITAVLSSLWPALRAGRAKPADALRQV